jgi:pimeloyl-ACP methyl ester carboxylesterase
VKREGLPIGGGVAAYPGGDLTNPQLMGKRCFSLFHKMGTMDQKSTHAGEGKRIFSLLVKLYMMAAMWPILTVSTEKNRRPIKLICFLILLALTGCVRVPVPPNNLEHSWGERQIFDYHGVKINYYEAGQGPPVILLHGFGACTYTWRFLAPVLAQDHRVFAIDLKGFGLSDKPADGKYAVSDQADMVAAFIRRRDLSDLALVGHSMGGAVALMTYLKVRQEAPARIKKLVLIDSAGYPQKMPWFIRFAQIPIINAIGGRLLPPRFVTYLVLRKCYYNKDKITEEQIDTYAYYGSLPGAREAVTATAQQIMPVDLDVLIAQYKTISVPVLIIWGAKDEVVPLSVGKKFKRDIPESRLVIIPKCGHIPPEEQPQATQQAIVSFLKKQELKN